ncbi:hypothetical protein CXB51_005405 [Gossypium anomalum]|uniref:Gag-asp_proteas domain-containing protein n=1 Tax=Gossypium anomalum TaxID=47600 RepID=A0A8J5ZMJ5_9ROSI|nr:hypothetical protein CXB51_005405 [Gossypium anomalum]
MINTTAGGTIKNKTPEEAYAFIKEMSQNNYQWHVMRTKPTKTAGVYNVDSVHPVMRCDPSGGGVHTEYQPFNLTTEEEQNTETALKNQQALIQGLETQIGQLSKLISKQPQGGLHSNRKPKEHVKAVTLRSVKVLAESEKKLTQEAVTSEREEENPKTETNQCRKNAYIRKILKDLLTNKRKFEDFSTVELNEECSAILQNKLPTKLKDPGSFTIPCLIGSLNVENALTDLGASINLMPYKMFKQLGLEEPKPTRMSIQLADRSVKYLGVL